MRILAITGWSGSGKTTLLVETVARLVGRGERVAAIKHTHHAVNDSDRGDTARMRAAGADPVVLAGDGEAVVFSSTGTDRIVYAGSRDLLARLDADVVLIEGFKGETEWPRIELDAHG